MGTESIRQAISATLKTLKNPTLSAKQRLDLTLFVKDLREELRAAFAVNKARNDKKRNQGA